MSPFYPLKAKEKNISVVYVGFVMGVMAATQIVSSFIIGKFMHNFQEVGRHHIIMLGTFLIIIQTASLGYLDNVNDRTVFLTISFAAQILGGFGAGSNSTACMAMLSSFDGHEREQYIGQMEAAFGMGFLFGPLFGAFLYNIGGY